MKSHVLSLWSLSRITNTLKGHSNGSTGWRLTIHQLSTGFICLWRVTTTMYNNVPVDWLAGVSAPCCHLGTLGTLSLCDTTSQPLASVAEEEGWKVGLTAQEQHTPFPYSHPTGQYSHHRVPTNPTKAGRTAPELFTEHSTSLGRISRKCPIYTR